MPLIHWIDGYKGAVRAPGAKKGAVVEDIVTHLSPVKRELGRHAMRGYAKAKAYHAVVQGNYPGESTWVTISGPPATELDYHVHLWSVRGGKAAAAIEYGHTGTGVDPRSRIHVFQKAGKRYEGAFILHRAFGLKRKGG